MSKYQRLPVADLIVDDGYQRRLDEKRVQRMAKDFRPEMLGTLEVSRHNGRSAVFDGQHRLAAAKLVGLETLPCLVHSSMSREDEADLFYRLQRDRKAVHPVEAFKARLVAGDPGVAEIHRLASDAGFVVGYKPSADRIAAVATLERVHARGVLGETLELMGLWKGDVGVTDAGFIDGLSLLVQGYGHRLSSDVRSKLRAVSAALIVRNAMSRMMRERGYTQTQNKSHYVLTELRKTADLTGAPRGAKRRKKRV